MDGRSQSSACQGNMDHIDPLHSMFVLTPSYVDKCCAIPAQLIVRGLSKRAQFEALEHTAWHSGSPGLLLRPSSSVGMTSIMYRTTVVCTCDGPDSSSFENLFRPCVPHFQNTLASVMPSENFASSAPGYNARNRVAQAAPLLLKSLIERSSDCKMGNRVSTFGRMPTESFGCDPVLTVVGIIG